MPLDLASPRAAQARRMLMTSLPATVIADATGLTMAELQQVSAAAVRDALCRTTAQGFRPQAHIRRHGNANDDPAIAAHAARMAKAKPVSEAEMQAQIAAHLARKGATACPAAPAAGLD